MDVEKELSEKLKKIFKVKKVSFDDPGPAGEQECLFIAVEKSTNSARDGVFKAMVQGTCLIFGTNLKLPFGYISKCLQEADSEDTVGLHCYDLETNTRQFKDKVQRGFSFVYFFSSQYDPEKGTLEEIDFTTQET